MTRTRTLFHKFFKSEQAGGILLIVCTCLSLIVSNLPSGEEYIALWDFSFGGLTVLQWINDALMAVFFLMVGLELEREIFIGELSKFKQAIVPVAAAVGGMLVPALLYVAFNQGSPYAKGFGIPMATDIAFSLTILSLFSKRVPFGLRIFLTALAIADDLGAIMVIALFYSNSVSWFYLAISLALFVVMFIMGRMKVYILWPYLVGGVLMWYTMHHSGIHATIAGVMLAFAIPFGDKDTGLSHRLQAFLHLPVAFIILPLFALANTCISISGLQLNDLETAGVYGTIAGLVIGKPLGIYLFTFLSKNLLGWSLSPGVTMKHILGAGIVAGIGFTMSIFITDLAFTSELYIKQVKLAILISAILSSLAGVLYFRLFIPKTEVQ